MTKDRLQNLFKQHVQRINSQEEEDELMLYIANQDFKDQVIDCLNGIILSAEESKDLSEERARIMLEKILDKNYSHPPKVQRIHFLKTTWFRYAAAILLIFGLGAYLYITQKSKPVPTEMAIIKDVPAPEINRATLTLANGQKIFLDSTGNGILAREGQTNIEKTAEGSIVYRGEATRGEIKYNTLSVPRGSQIASIVLSDGSKVFLNASSSLKYPVSFENPERKVEISGEAYFEIAKDSKRKFVVISGEMKTEVLGTQFNVNSYNDDNEGVKLTLVEGSVRVSSPRSQLIIKPGQEAGINKDNQLEINSNADMTQAIAWHKGMFVFDKMNLTTILKQVSRWYNVDIDYRDTAKPMTFSGVLSRRSSLSGVIKMLEANGVKCNINGSLLIIEKQ